MRFPANSPRPPPCPNRNTPCVLLVQEPRLPGGLSRDALIFLQGLSEGRSDEIVAVLNDLDLREKIEKLIRWYLRERVVLRPVTLEVDE